MPSQGSNAVVHAQHVGNITHLHISGVIDETFSLQTARISVRGLVLLDLGRVERISSFGVRRWVEFVSKLPPDATAMYIIHAPPMVVDQLNMVDGFSGVARVLTLLAPYRCRACGEDRLRLVDLQRDAQIILDGKAPEHTCPVCQSVLEFADLPLEFFDYARRQQFGSIDQAVSRYLKLTVAQEQGELANHLKIIQDDITFVSVASVLNGDLNVRRLSAGLEGRVAFDFSHVTRVEPEAFPRLAQAMDLAAANAQVFLCRVPSAVLQAIYSQGPNDRFTVATLWLPSECKQCGNRHHQRLSAATYLSLLKHQESLERACIVCGGSSKLEALPQLLPILSRARLTEQPLDEIEQLEFRALSQYLFGLNQGEPPSGRSGQSDLNTSLGSSRLQIIRRLGQGGMAEVFLAKQLGVKNFEKFVVMKKILAQFAESAEFVEMLFAEARANARLTHPNIVQTFDVGLTEGVAYITMEYVRGPDLKRVMTELRRKNMALPIEHALRITAETAAGLHYAHNYVDPAGTPHPVVHRDVSPHNILISLDGAVKLSDFGIAKVQGEETTQAGVLKGKISYISPEAAAGRPLDGRNDVFALGVVLFELLTGKLPFRRDHDAATLNAIVREPAPDPAQLNPLVPSDVSDLVLRALVKDPARRTPSAGAMREELEAVMARHRMSSSPVAVAQFIRDTLTERLADFAPSGVISPPPALAPSVPAPAVPTELDSGAFLEVEITSSLSDNSLIPSTGLAPPLAGEPPTVAARPPKGRGTDSMIRATFGEENPQAPWLEQGRVLSPPPVDGAAQERAPSRSPPVFTPPPMAARRPSQEPTTQSLSRPPARWFTPRMWRYGLGIGVAVVGLGLGAWALTQHEGSHLRVLNLGSDEQLYVEGRRVDPSRVELSGEGPLTVSTARNGRLYRFGTSTQRDRIDVRTLPEAPTFTGSTGLMRLETHPPHCKVDIATRWLSETTPLQTEIEAGKELQVTVYCPNLSVWSEWVMAVPGQEIQLSARLKN